MFTGIVEETGAIESIRTGKKSIRLAIAANKTARGAKLGDSLAVENSNVSDDVGAVGGLCWQQRDRKDDEEQSEERSSGHAPQTGSGECWLAAGARLSFSRNASYPAAPAYMSACRGEISAEPRSISWPSVHASR